MKNFKWKSSYVLIGSILLGTILGIVMKDYVTYIKPLGNIFINLLFMIVVPLIFFLISSSITKFANKKKFGNIVITSIIVFLLTSLISSIVMLGTLTLANPKIDNIQKVEKIEVEEINIGDKITETLTVDDFSKLLSKKHLLPLIIFSCLIGFGVTAAKEKGEPFQKFLESGSVTLIKAIDIIMYYAPIGIMAYFANLIAEIGPELIGTYAKYLIIYLIACLIYFILFYSLYAYLANRKKGVKDFWKNIPSAAFTSLSTCSSLATLPINMQTTNQLKIPEKISSISLPLGAAIHMEGSSMGTVLKIMFLFTIFGQIFFTLPNIIITLLFATLICTAMSGIPSGGLISEMLILSIFGFPITAYPLLTTIAWLIDAPATCLNATGDIPATMLISKKA